MEYYSQSNQDKWVVEFLKFKKMGTLLNWVLTMVYKQVIPIIWKKT